MFTKYAVIVHTQFIFRLIIIYRSGRKTGQTGKEKSMYETIKIVNGHEIRRMVGTRCFYHVRIDNVRFVTFRTIKAAAAFCETL